MARIDFTTAEPAKEADIQKTCWEWLGYYKLHTGESLQDYSYMVPNGTQLGGSRERRGQYMASLKAQGFRPGVSDIVIAYPSYDYHGAYIELKRDRKAYKGPAAIASAVRDEQKDWLLRMREVWYFVAVAYGFEEFKDAVGKYMAGEDPPELGFG